MDGKAHNAGLSQFEKTWLKACWNVVMSVERRRNYIQEQITERASDSMPTPSFTRAETAAGMGHLYDFLATTELAPDCTKHEFVTGWTELIELVDQIKKRQETDQK